jgi:hypothetical protein
VTANGNSLKPEHFGGAGVANLENLHVVGLENNREWRKIFEAPETRIHVEVFADDLVELTRTQSALHRLHAILLECTDLPPFANRIRQATGLPVFDFVTLVNDVHQAISGPPDNPPLKHSPQKAKNGLHAGVSCRNGRRSKSFNCS